MKVKKLKFLSKKKMINRELVGSQVDKKKYIYRNLLTRVYRIIDLLGFIDAKNRSQLSRHVCR